VGPRTGLGNIEKRKFLPLPGLEFQPLSRPAHSQSLYWLRYPSCLKEILGAKEKNHEVEFEIKTLDRIKGQYTG
jgi:hypothetical protein